MHHELLGIRGKLFKQIGLLQTLGSRPGVRQMLDIGCGDGDKALRLSAPGLHPVGIELSRPRLLRARRQGLDVAQSTGECLPFADRSIDLIHMAHALHHIPDHTRTLAEIRRCLAPEGRLLLVETVTDHPLIRIGRAIYPAWRGDDVHHDWRYAELVEILGAAGLAIEETARFNIVFWMWEVLPLSFWPLEVLTPVFVYLDLLLAPWLRRYAAHCSFVLRHDNVRGEDAP